MTYNTTDERIKTAYEVEGMSPDEIASDEQLSVVAVKAKLMQISTKYRKDCKCEPAEEDTLNFTDDQLRQVNQVILETALGAETPDGEVDYKTRLAAATYIRDDKKGRKELRSVVQNNQWNVLTLNERLLTANQAADKMKEIVEVSGK